MKTLFFSFLLLAFQYTTSFSQVTPGHLGKRFFAEIGATTRFTSALSFSLPTSTLPAEFDIISSPLTFYANANFNYVLAKPITVNLDYFYGQTDANYSFSNVGPQSRSVIARYQISIHNIRLGYDYYLPMIGSLAPVGAYIGVGFNILPTGLLIKEQIYEDNNEMSDYDANSLNTPSSFLFTGISYRIGYRAVYRDRITFNISLEGLFVDLASFSIENRQTFRSTISESIRSSSYIGLQISAGYLF